MTVNTSWSRPQCQQFCEGLRQTDISNASSYPAIISAIEEIASTALDHLNKSQVRLLDNSLERMKNQLLANQKSWYTYLCASANNNEPLLQQIAVLKEIFSLHSRRPENPDEHKERRAYKALPPNERFDKFFHHVHCSKRARASRTAAKM